MACNEGVTCNVRVWLAIMRCGLQYEEVWLAITMRGVVCNTQGCGLHV